MSDLPKPIRTVLAVLGIVGMGIAAYAMADDHIHELVDRSQKPLAQQVERLDGKVDKVIDILLKERR